MSKKDEILNCCRDQARNAGEIASLLQLDKTVVKITLLYCFKRGLVTREKSVTDRHRFAAPNKSSSTYVSNRNRDKERQVPPSLGGKY
jgi:7-cyano-7-deazaguanine synthase in queuosine biosynthesis